MKYEPYKTDHLLEAMKYFYNLGWYGGKRELLKVTMLGEFEGFSGRASETWEHLFCAENCAIEELHIQSHKAFGNTLDEACEKLLQELAQDNT